VLPGPIRLKSFGDDPSGIAGRNLLNLHLKPGPILSWAPRKDYDRALAQFKRDLIAKQVEDREAKHRTPLLMLPDTELELIDKEHRNRLRKDVAKAFLRMWEEIEKAHKAHSDAKGISIGVASAYRSAQTDQVAWNTAFANTYYPQTLEARLATGDEFGSKSLKLIFERHPRASAVIRTALPLILRRHKTGITTARVPRGQASLVGRRRGYTTGWLTMPGSTSSTS
jgi:hypothetical protein